MNVVKETVKSLRKNQTGSELILWQILRNRKLDGKRFNRQHEIEFKYEGKRRFFVADFNCHEMRLVIELDGKIHERQVEYGQFRTLIINQLGIQVLRIKNEELKDISKVMAKIRDLMSQEPK